MIAKHERKGHQKETEKINDPHHSDHLEVNPVLGTSNYQGSSNKNRNHTKLSRISINGTEK